MKAYSNDLRRARIAAYETHDYSPRQVAALFGVSPAPVRNVVRRKRDTGTPDALPRAGGKRETWGQPVQNRVRQLAATRHDLTLAAWCEQIPQEYTTQVSVATRWRLLQRLGLPRKTSRSLRRTVIPHGSSRRD